MVTFASQTRFYCKLCGTKEVYGELCFSCGTTGYIMGFILEFDFPCDFDYPQELLVFGRLQDKYKYMPYEVIRVDKLSVRINKLL